MDAEQNTFGARVLRNKVVVLYHLALGFVASAIGWVCQHCLYSQGVEQGKSLGLDTNHPYFKFLREQQVVHTGILWKGFMILMTVFLLAGVGSAGARRLQRK